MSNVLPQNEIDKTQIVTWKNLIDCISQIGMLRINILNHSILIPLLPIKSCSVSGKLIQN